MVGVCGCGEPARYKCPQCRAPYCSVSCCRDHKAQMHPVAEDESGAGPGEGKKDPGSPLRPAGDSAPQPPHALAHDAALAMHDDEEENKDILLPQQLASLGTSTRLRNYFSDSRLQSIVRAIDGADDREKALDAALAADPDLRAVVTHMLTDIGYEA